MVEFFRIVTWILLITLAYFNLFNVAPKAVVIGTYPYLVGITIILGLSMIMLRFTHNRFGIIIIQTLLVSTLVFGLFTFVQVWRNSQLFNDYQKNRSGYMDELMQITRKGSQEQDLLNSFQKGIANLIEKNIGIPLTYHNKATLFFQEEEIFDEMIESISQAKHHIHIEFFIIRDDEIGKKFRNILIGKAKEGVEVRIVYDGLGSHGIKRSYVRELREVGVEIVAYDTVIQSILKGKLNHRNHRKLVIIDGKVGFTGGVNIGDEYLGRDDQIGKWKDMQVKIEGEAVNWMQKIFLGDWYYVTDEQLEDERYFPKQDRYDQLPIQLVTSGYDTHWNEISQLYFTMATGAQESLYIATPYLILNDSMIKALETAALRGVDVKIVLPKKADFFLVGWANESYFERLLKASVEIYQYDEGFLHSKVFVADRDVLSVGSANLNTRSLFLDYEVNAVIFDEELVGKMVGELSHNIADSKQLTLKEHQRRSFLQKVKEFIGRLIVPIA
ncbi:phospholipase D/Transphosphatidylase [Alkaliphilus metalliredigens QYMF]|uniref:Cardiolipin synthase n=1 Tax=Alkaliphilus metalliredigens (strain QYMF) TaxID=293826 RepID=A6TMF9_ALKMQ|nr:cardiolipin synthase [Alkaliphilus metalliredigens]ABR47377.1 phospholipase D/Transphosphatidylase [Alkaliphilus metalliredigens QYMF]